MGTSLFFPNLAGLKSKAETSEVSHGLRPLVDAYLESRWETLADLLATRDPTERLCGAEINSIASLISNRHIHEDSGLYFFHSATDDGRNIARVLQRLYRSRGHAPVEAVEVEDLQDQDAKRFRTRGLRSLARQLCAVVRAHSAPACAINATGGYKAQIAIAVMLGQALGIPVYYMHERFSEIIAFPPLPVALDFEVWMQASGLLLALESAGSEPVPREQFEEEWDERWESLVESVRVDDREYVELSPTGQIFQDTFRERFRSARDQVLPPPAAQKQKPTLRSNEAHMLGHREEIQAFMDRVTDEVAQVVSCTTSYFNPDLPERSRFREGARGIQGVYSEGAWTVKFRVETTASTPGQRAAVVAALNQWLADRGRAGDRR